MFTKFLSQCMNGLRYPATDKQANNVVEFRIGLIVSISILLSVSVLNKILDNTILDIPIVTRFLIVQQVVLLIASYYYTKMWDFFEEFTTFTAITYVSEVIVAAYQKGFDLPIFAGMMLVIFLMGGSFKRKKYLIFYYFVTNTLATLLMIFCPHIKIEVLYGVSVNLIDAAVGIYLFASRINSMVLAVENEAWFQNLFDNVPVSIALITPEIKIFKINLHFQNILGFTESEIIASGLDPIIHAEDRVSDDILQKALFSDSMGRFDTEMRLYNKAKQLLWMKVTMTMTHSDNTLIHKSKRFAIITFDDITEKKQANLLLQQQNQALEEFSYVISHDLQEPLRMITSFSQIIQRRYLAKLNNPDIDRDFNFVIDGAKRMSKLIKDMLEYSRWTSQQFPIEKVDTQHVIAEVLQNLTLSIGQADAEITVGELPILMANRLVISQVFQNLIGNSINYRHPDRKPNIQINFTYQCETKNWLCSVRDNGRGFDDKQKERIFGIFQRLHTDKKGTGMGLAICKRIIEKQGGKIWAEGVPDEGATFLFTV